MELKEIIREYKQKTGISDSELARRMNIDRSTAMRWSNGSVKRLSSETMERLSQLVGYQVEPVLKGYDLSMRLPVLGYVKAGYDLFADENYLGEEDVTSDEHRIADYYLRVTGDSMSGIGIMDGSMVLVQKCDQLHHGDIGIVMIGDEVTIKRVLYKDQMMILEAANPDYDNRYFSAEEIQSLPVRIIGKAISCKTSF